MDTGKSFMSSEQTKSTGDNALALQSYIKHAQPDRNAWHVDIVAHSLGSLISRYYISQIMEGNLPDGRRKVAHLVMLGTPNQGSPCADVMDLAFGMIGKQVEAVRQLQPDYVAGFNRVNYNRKGVKFSALAGNPLPTMCKSIVANDGVVSVPSAKWTIADTAESKSLHTDLTGTTDFSSFVKPRLAIGPRGSHEPDAPSLPQNPNQSSRNLNNNFAPMFVKASFGKLQNRQGFQPEVGDQKLETSASLSLNANNSEKPVFAKAVKLAPNQTIENKRAAPGGEFWISNILR